MSDVAAELRTLLGADRVHTDDDSLTRCSRDTWPLRLLQAAVGGARTERPLCVVLPRSADEVARTLAHLDARGVPVVPYGGGSGVQGGAEGRADAVVLALAALDRTVALDADNLLVTAQAGVVLADLTAWLDERGFTLGHFPQSIALAQLGGLVATRSSGQFSTKYGGIEELVLALEAVLPDGTIVRTGGLPRRSAGPDLRHLWIGSEGVLGIVTEVTLRIAPAPAERQLAAYVVPSFRDGLHAVRALVQAGWRPAVLRLYDEVETARGFSEAAGAGEAILLTLAEGAVGQVAPEAAAIRDAALAVAGARELGAAPVEAWLEHRNDVADFYRFVEGGVLVDTIDIAAPWSVVADVYDEVLAALRERVPELLVASAHSSHSYPQGTSLYFVVAAEPATDPAEVERVYWSIWSAAMETALARGAAIAHHHGIGKARSRWLGAELGSSYELLVRVKAALDPGGRMNPGTLLG